MPRVVDNTVLSNFCRIGRMDLLSALFDKVYVTYEVREEVLRGLEEGYSFLEQAAKEIKAGSVVWLELTGFESSAEEEAFRKFTETLGYGEASCLALAQARGWLILTDDLRARRLARRLGVDVTGTLGILALLVEKGILDLADSDHLVQKMIAEGYRSPYGSLTEFLHDI
jgi:predicted nucleic acid-binding protein